MAPKPGIAENRLETTFLRVGIIEIILKALSDLNALNIVIEPAEGNAEDPTIMKSKMFHGSLKNLCLYTKILSIISNEKKAKKTLSNK